MGVGGGWGGKGGVHETQFLMGGGGERKGVGFKSLVGC